MQAHAFKTPFAETIFQQKFKHEGCETWPELAHTVVEDVCKRYMSNSEKAQLKQYIIEMKFVPGGRYIYYAGRPHHFWNNCFMFNTLEDSREDWAQVSYKVVNALMTGGGLGVEYSTYRPEGSLIKRTGGFSSGPIPKMEMTNEEGRRVMQGGSRRSALWAGLNWQHADARKLIYSKDWHNIKIPGTDKTVWDVKTDPEGYNFPAPLDMTNISLCYDDEWLEQIAFGELPRIYIENVRQALKTGEPGFAFNFGKDSKEILRNAPVSANTWVLLDYGYEQIKNIVNTKVIVWTGKQWSETVFKKTKNDVQTVKVNMTGGRTISADPSHEFLVERWIRAGKKSKFLGIDKVPACELKEGDQLHVSYPKAEIKERDDNWYLKGFVFGDGSFTRQDGNAEVTFCTNEKKECAIEIDIENMSVCKSITWNDSRGYSRAYLKDHWYVGKERQHMPNVSNEKLASFIAGLFDADGSFCEEQNKIRFSSQHNSFLEDLRRALELLGIQSGICNAGCSGYTGKQCELLVVCTDSNKRFAEIIPTIRLKVSDHKSYRPQQIKVKSLELGDIEDVYCCDVGVEEHSFMAEGVIISNCTELTSEDDSDVCNIGSLNFANITDRRELNQVIELATKFLICGTLGADLPFEAVYKTREKNRRLGLGIMGFHEWLLMRGYRYEVVPEMHLWLNDYMHTSNKVSAQFADYLGISRPVKNRAIAPTGTIGILAGTTTGIEPMFAAAYKRRYLKGIDWHYQYVVDPIADRLAKQGHDADKIEGAIDLARDPERRIKCQYDIQHYVDHAISSTINLPAWGSTDNNEDKVIPFAKTLAKYAHGLRGFTCYPDGARGGQPLTSVPYSEAHNRVGEVFREAADICDITGKGGTCGG